MDDAPLTPYKLRVFCEVVERQSFTLAADHLFTTQPAISVHVRGLERYFGTRLIYREGRRSLPTEAEMVDIAVMPLFWEVVPILMVKGVTGPQMALNESTHNIWQWDRQ